MHDWVGEGEPTWVMAKLHPTATVYTKHWETYANSPQTVYLDRAYDGVGLFGHLGDVLGKQDAVWPLLVPIDVAGINGNDDAAWATLVNGHSERYYSTWGASYYQDSGHADWHMGGPSTTPPGPTAESFDIPDGSGDDVAELPNYEATLVNITTNANVLIVYLVAGFGKLHDSGYKVDLTLDAFAPVALCLGRLSCACPKKSPGASFHFIQASGPVSLGLDGGSTALAAYAMAKTVKDYCDKPRDPPPPRPGSGGGGGGAGGGEPDLPHNGTWAADPHVQTFDSVGYDLQTVGEMTLVKSTTDNFTVQVRTAALPGSNGVALTTAVAARVGGHRIMIAPENGAIQAHVDGAAIIDEVTKLGGGTLQRLDGAAGQGYLIETPDGTRVRVDPFTLGGVNVTVMPSAARAGKLAGLLGNDNGQTNDDYVTADGHSLGTAPSRAALNTTYTDSWRVSPATSLFTYAPGQSTATFTDKTYPHVNVDATNAPDRATVEQQCRAEGITDPFLLQDCIVDASAIHSYAVLGHYAQAQTVLSVQTAIAHGRPPFAATPSTPSPASTTTPTTEVAPALRTIVDAGRANAPAESVPFSFPAHAGDVIWVSFPNCDDGGLTFAVNDPTGKTLNQDQVSLALSGCLAGRFVLPVDGSYQLVANVDHQKAGSFTLPIRFEPRDVVMHASYGQALSGTIAAPAAHVVYQFDAQEGDAVHIFGPGCTIGSADRINEVGLEKSDGTPVIAIDCGSASQGAIQQAGSYQLVVNFSNTGPYHYSFVLQR